MSVLAALPDVRTNRQFEYEVLEGLSQARKHIPSTWLYDLRGSELFEEITQLEEYYPTRTEIGVLSDSALQMASRIGAGATVVEFGSGSSRKTPLLLRALPSLQAYVPVDISAEFLFAAVRSLRSGLPTVRCHPVVADFSHPDGLKEVSRMLPSQGARVGFFPGSTIGNFAPAEAVRLLRQFGEMLGSRSLMLIGVDTTRDARVLIPAYDDAKGVTAAFNLNLLVRINRELAGSFQLDGFRHEARFDPDLGRIEMHLVSRRVQEARVMGRRFAFQAGESIHTENSYKYPGDDFKRMSTLAGWTHIEQWTDGDKRFAIHLLRCQG